MPAQSEIADTLDIVNCAQLFYEIEEAEIYMCPAEGGSYSHKPCRFFGMYKDKKVEYVAEIQAVIDVTEEFDSGILTVKAQTLWEQDSRNNLRHQKTAIEKALHFRPDRLPLRVFILANRSHTNFIKDSKGGMLTSKTYLDVSSLKAKDAKDLAAKLEGKQWSDFGI
jgi:hypothetical protein